MALKKHVAVYARVSTGGQSSGMQLRELRAFCRRRGFTIVKEYVDQVTGNVAARRRRRDLAYIDLMNDAVRSTFDTVIVWKFDRFARSLSALIEGLQTFSSLGIDFISVTEAIDTTTPQGRLFFGMVGCFAEFEREMIADRVRAGLAHARAKGTQLGRPRDMAAAVKVRKLAGRFSISEIARRTKLSRAGVRKILAREKA